MASHHRFRDDKMANEKVLKSVEEGASDSSSVASTDSAPEARGPYLTPVTFTAGVSPEDVTSQAEDFEATGNAAQALRSTPVSATDEDLESTAFSNVANNNEDIPVAGLASETLNEARVDPLDPDVTRKRENTGVTGLVSAGVQAQNDTSNVTNKNEDITVADKSPEVLTGEQVQSTAPDVANESGNNGAISVAQSASADKPTHGNVPESLEGFKRLIDAIATRVKAPDRDGVRFPAPNVPAGSKEIEGDDNSSGTSEALTSPSSSLIAPGTFEIVTKPPKNMKDAADGLLRLKMGDSRLNTSDDKEFQPLPVIYLNRIDEQVKKERKRRITDGEAHNSQFLEDAYITKFRATTRDTWVMIYQTEKQNWRNYLPQDETEDDEDGHWGGGSGIARGRNVPSSSGAGAASNATASATPSKRKNTSSTTSTPRKKPTRRKTVVTESPTELSHEPQPKITITSGGRIIKKPERF